MHTQEVVENYVKNHKTKFKNFFIVQVIAEIVQITIFIFVLLKFIDNSTAINICVVTFIVVLEASIFLNIKFHFGNLKNFLKSMNINGIYSKASKEYQKTGNRELFSQKLNELEKEINS